MNMQSTRPDARVPDRPPSHDDGHDDGSDRGTAHPPAGAAPAGRPVPELRPMLGDLFLKATDVLTDVFTRACATEGLSMSEGRALRLVAGGATQNQLMDLLGCSPSRVTEILQCLEAGGRVVRRRSRGDRRRHDVAVTEAGCDALRRIDRRLDATSPLVRNLDERDRIDLRRVLERLLDGVVAA